MTRGHEGDAPLLVIAAGGTGGHMFPAQALAEAMLARGWRVALSTDARGLRYAGGFPEAVTRHALSAASFARGGLAGKLAAGPRLLWGVAQAWRWFRRARPAAVAGFGGYPAFPALAAAGLRRVPRLIHEQNGVLGRVNRLFARRVNSLACGTWPVTNAPAGAPLVHIGNPTRPTVRPAPYTPPGETVELLVFGGSQGASVFAKAVPPALAALPEGLRARLRVAQQAREGEVEATRAALGAAGIAAEVAPFFADMPERLARSHLVIARAGASTVAELATVGRPAILVPFAAAMDDHQAANARALAEAGGATVIAERDLTAPELAETLAALLPDGARLAAMAEAARTVACPEAARDLADLVEAIATGHGG
jgi:UDP-N-acetylglucosamine--N-acetylmuramyl-(pentapeptide) pyrophosphoryl-undecaprenol N-acetylglucosamine transferase